MIEAALAAGLGLVAAAGVYLSVINRLLTHLRHPGQKLAALFGLMIGLSGLYFGLGLFGGRTGLWIILSTLFVLALGDLYYRLGRKRLQGTPPVKNSGPRRSIFRPNTTLDLNVIRYQVALDGGDAFDRRPSSSHECEDRQDPPLSERRLRVAHLSDLHLNHRLPTVYYEQVAKQVRAADPDLVFITGDFVTKAEGIFRFPALAKDLAGRFGTYAIFGNHDYWAGPELVAKVVGRTGVCLLGNGWKRVNANGRRLILVGCEQPWNRSPLEIPPAEDGELLLALSHSADHIYRLNALGAAAVFSGHYHAGQFQIPGFGPVLIPSNYGRRFHHGHFVVGGTHLFVTAGVGASDPALRLYCPPDVMIVDFI